MSAAHAATPGPMHPVARLCVVPLRRAQESGAAPASRCRECRLRRNCLPGGLHGDEEPLLDGLVYTRKRVKRRGTLCRAGSPFDALYAVRSGSFKSATLLEDGRDQVTAFHLPGDLIGLEGLGAGTHANDVVALEDSEVCVIPYSHLDAAPLQKQLHRLMGREIARDRGAMVLLGTMRAEERLGSFLAALAQRLADRGYCATEFHLRMTRREIGSHLGLSLETVSRLFTRLQDKRLIAVEQRHVRILDLPGLLPSAMRAVA